MSETRQCYVVAENKPGKRVILRLGDQYACVRRGQPISEYSWRDHKLLSSMIMKGGYTELSTPVLFKPFNDHINKSVKLYIEGV